MRTLKLKFPALLAAAALVLAACASDDGTGATGEPQRHVLSIQAVQVDMERHVDRTAFPDTLDRWPDFDQWPGYRLDEPDDDGFWYARAYVFQPSTIVVNQGDEVVLQFFGIHGDEHPSFIQGYDVSFSVRRGEVEVITFTADKAGVFPIICAAHLPSMVGQLVVLSS